MAKKIEQTPQTQRKVYDHGNVILRFNEVDFEHFATTPILDEASFSVREKAKITLMGQNGAGKSTIFNLITGMLKPEEGKISIQDGTTIGVALQVIPHKHLDKTVVDFFETAFDKKIYDIEPRAKKVMNAVNLDVPLDQKVETLSGGQQARLLLAYALISEPDILLLDEPTNNLDKEGIAHLTDFLKEYPKTCIVISHDADFLNEFTHGVLYLDSYTHKVEQYVGDYKDVVKEISARIERERAKNVRLEHEIQDRKEKASFFAQKGGHMRDVARKMKEKIETLEGELVDMRGEDRTIGKFFIQAQETANIVEDGKIVTISSATIFKNGKKVEKKVTPITLRSKQKLLIEGPNGIGKSTFITDVAAGKAKGVKIYEDIKIGYYAQDFSELDQDESVYKILADASTGQSDEELRSTAAQFLLTSESLKKKVSDLSEGQKGLLMFAKFVLEKPAVLILDEPSNHINFRHLPVIAESLNKYEGVLILVSHMKDFVEKIKVDEKLDLGKF